MARTAEPWPWEARKGFYAWVGGKRHRLCAISDGIRAAKTRLREIQNEHDLAVSVTSDVPTVGKLILDYIVSLRHRREADDVNSQTKADAERRLAGFGELYATFPSDKIRVHHVDAWLATKTEWGKTSRHDGVATVKSAFRWAIKKGHIDHNPLAELEKPKRKARREEIPTPEEIARAFAAKMIPELRDIFTFLHDTGARPKEARTTEAKHFDRTNEMIVLTEHKTSRKTSKKRTIQLQGRSLEIVTRLCEIHPEGPIFLNSKGRPWTKDHLVHAVAALKKRAGIKGSLIAYSLRHVYITDAAAAGVAGPVLAEMAGHADMRMLSTYSHVSERQDAIKEAAAKVAKAREATKPK